MFTNRAFKNLNKFLHSKNVTDVHFRLTWKAGILIKFLVKQLQYFTDLHRTPYNLNSIHVMSISSHINVIDTSSRKISQPIKQHKN